MLCFEEIPVKLGVALLSERNFRRQICAKSCLVGKFETVAVVTNGKAIRVDIRIIIVQIVKRERTFSPSTEVIIQVWSKSNTPFLPVINI